MVASCVCGYDIVPHMARHKRTCKVLKMSGLESENARLLAEVASFATENERLRAENLELMARLEEARAARPVQNVNNNVTINVVPYGQEEALSAADVRSILQQLPGSETIPRYI